MRPIKPWATTPAKSLQSIHVKSPANKERSDHFGRAGCWAAGGGCHIKEAGKIHLPPRWPWACFLAFSCPVVMVSGQEKQPWPEMGMDTRGEDLGCPLGMQLRPGAVQAEDEGQCMWGRGGSWVQSQPPEGCSSENCIYPITFLLHVSHSKAIPKSPGGLIQMGCTSL